jgi:hypothetical protein
MSTPQSWVEVPAPDPDGQPWLETLVVKFRDEASGRRLVHLDQRSFAATGRVERARDNLFATFVVSKALSITVQVQAGDIDADTGLQEFTFIDRDVDLLDLIVSMASMVTVH